MSAAIPQRRRSRRKRWWSSCRRCSSWDSGHTLRHCEDRDAWQRYPLARAAGEPQHEHQDFGHRLVKIRRDLLTQLDLGQRAGQNLVLLDWDVVSLGDLDDLGADRALALGND